ncbi:hypothetical protein DRO58_04940 [Candidatus Bathyarchaeota archaeon]|nr:MAG: hypothetical protein DRO58_04940 [Candidatus Bathyarchaeota archaeon]
MAGGYVLCEYESVKKEFPEFKRTMEDLERRLIEKAEADWAPLKYAGRRKEATFGFPGPGLETKAGEFGRTSIIPSLFVDNTGTRMSTWDQWLTSTAAYPIPGHKMIMAGVATGYTIPEDFKVGLAGIAFLDKTIRITEIKMQISDRKLPRINIEEALVYNKPAIIFEEGFILDEKAVFELWAYCLTEGPQRIKLIGFQVNRVKDKLFTEPGAALV